MSAANALEQVLSGLQGTIRQVPPMYSALKHQGKALYEYARQGIDIEREARQVQIFTVTLLDFSRRCCRYCGGLQQGHLYPRAGGRDWPEVAVGAHLIGLCAAPVLRAFTCMTR